MKRTTTVLLAALLGAAGCTRGGEERGGGTGADPTGSDGGPGAATGELRIEPATAEVSVVDGIPANLDYRAFLMDEDGREIEVTDETTFTLSHGDFGSFAGAHFTSATDRGGHTKVIGMARGKAGQADLTIRLERVILGPGATEGDPDLFDGADDPSRAPELVYPPDGIIVPANLNQLEVHYMPSSNSVFELQLQGSALDVKVYFTCETLGAGCTYSPSEEVWTLLAEGERGHDVTYQLRGVDRSSPGSVGASAEQTLTFAEEDITGGLYYWNAGAGSVMRYDFGRRDQVAETYLSAPEAGASTCVGCHVLSRDGTRISVGLDIPSPSPYKVYDTGSRDLLYQQGGMFGGGANFFAFSPDNEQIMTSNGVDIVLRNAADGTALIEPLVERGAMPDWSPDGMRMVYAKPGAEVPCFGGLCGAPGVDSASLETMVFDGSTWMPGVTLVPGGSGENNYYPTWSPNGEWVLFNRSPSGQNSTDAPDAELWVVHRDGGTPFRLDRATSAHGDSWPKWDPTTYMHRGRQLMWMTFSSRRPYGLRLEAGARAQLWMTAFDPGAAAAGEPSDYPAFWFPYQDIESGNHIAQWVTSVDRQPCSEDTECAGGEFCEAGWCVPDLI